MSKPTPNIKDFNSKMKGELAQDACPSQSTNARESDRKTLPWNSG